MGIINIGKWNHHLRLPNFSAKSLSKETDLKSISTPGTVHSRVRANTLVFTTVLIGLLHQDFSLEISKKSSTIPSKALTMVNSLKSSLSLTIVRLMLSREMSLKCHGTQSHSTK